MEIQRIPLDQINPAKYNPRKDLKPGDAEYEKLKNSIDEFDLVESLVMNKRGNVLISGHQRLKILLELPGLGAAPKTAAGGFKTGSAQGDGSFVLFFSSTWCKIYIRGEKMPRAAREKSSTGIYHVMLRGINHQIIFEDDEDYQKYLQTLKTYQEKSGYIIYAWCLMGNHLHLLVKEEEEDLGIAFRRIGASYVYWYNWKYSRRGHLFQDRFKSEVVENDSYFLTVIRYIHQNPLKAGIVKDIADYRWSSYGEYIGKPWICDTNFALNMFSTDRAKAVKLFKEFNLAENEDRCLDYDQAVRLNDTEAADFIKSISGVGSPTEVQGFDKGKRNEIIKACKEKGLSFRQIERLTGVSFGVIRTI